MMARVVKPYSWHCEAVLTSAAMQVQESLEQQFNGVCLSPLPLLQLIVANMSAFRREKALRDEVQQAMDVLGEWQHYGRSRNAHFEDLVMVCTGKDAEIDHLRRQVSRISMQKAVLYQRYCLSVCNVLRRPLALPSSSIRPMMSLDLVTRSWFFLHFVRRCKEKPLWVP